MPKFPYKHIAFIILNVYEKKFSSFNLQKMYYKIKRPKVIYYVEQIAF